MTKRFPFSISVGIVASFAACTRPGPQVPLVATPSPNPPTAASAATVDSLIHALRELPGRLRYIDPERTGSVFDGSEALFRAIGEADTVAVPALIECFGNVEPTAATLDGRPVQLGKLCFRAFGYTHYYAQRLRSAAWMAELKTTGLLPAHLEATDEQLRLARDWWRRYYAAGSPLRP
jgi:hypothetical protein